MGTKAERRAASERVAAYHEARLGELIEYITAAIDRYRAGEIDAYTVDETIHHYHRAAREWKFCWSGGGGTHIEIIAHVLVETEVKGSPLEALLDEESYQGVIKEAEEKLQQFCADDAVTMPMDAFVITGAKK